jgi:hypothetical protein
MRKYPKFFDSVSCTITDYSVFLTTNNSLELKNQYSEDKNLSQIRTISMEDYLLEMFNYKK